MKKDSIIQYKLIKKYFFTLTLSIILIFSIFQTGALSSIFYHSIPTPSFTFESHGLINIDGNDALDAFPNHTGLGTSGSPYIIQNYEINASGFFSAIEIRNTESSSCPVCANPAPTIRSGPNTVKIVASPNPLYLKVNGGPVYA